MPILLHNTYYIYLFARAAVVTFCNADFHTIVESSNSITGVFSGTSPFPHECVTNTSISGRVVLLTFYLFSTLDQPK